MQESSSQAPSPGGGLRGREPAPGAVAEPGQGSLPQVEAGIGFVAAPSPSFASSPVGSLQMRRTPLIQGQVSRANSSIPVSPVELNQCKKGK